MALERSKRSEIPAGAIILSESDALRYQCKLLENWKVSSDVAGYKYSSILLAFSTSFTGIYLNNVFRTKFRLHNYAKISSYIPIAIIPGLMSIVLHRQFVLTDVVLQTSSCPVCLEMRGAALQASTGLLMPVLIAPVSTLSLVHRYATYDIPYISKEPRQLFSLLAKKIKPLKNTLFWMFIAHAILGSFVTYLELDSVWRVNHKLITLERELEATEGK